MRGSLLEKRWLLSANGPVDVGRVRRLGSVGQHGCDRRLALGRVEPAVGGLEDDLQDGAVALAELGLEDVRGLLGVRARNHELVLERALERPERQERQHDEEGQTAEDGPLRMVGLCARDARQRACDLLLTRTRWSWVVAHPVPFLTPTPQWREQLRSRIRDSRHDDARHPSGNACERRSP